MRLKDCCAVGRGLLLVPYSVFFRECYGLNCRAMAEFAPNICVEELGQVLFIPSPFSVCNNLDLRDSLLRHNLYKCELSIQRHTEKSWLRVEWNGGSHLW